jgi:hypothetical protein
MSTFRITPTVHTGNVPLEWSEMEALRDLKLPPYLLMGHSGGADDVQGLLQSVIADVRYECT